MQYSVSNGQEDSSVCLLWPYTVHAATCRSPPLFFLVPNAGHPMHFSSRRAHTKDIQYATRQCNKPNRFGWTVICNTGICRRDSLQEIVGKLCLKWRNCTTQRHHSLQGLHCFTGSPPTDPDHMWNTGCFEVPLFFNSRTPILGDSLQSWSCQHVFTIIDLDDKLKVD